LLDRIPPATRSGRSRSRSRSRDRDRERDRDRDRDQYRDRDRSGRDNYGSGNNRVVSALDDNRYRGSGGGGGNAGTSRPSGPPPPATGTGGPGGRVIIVYNLPKRGADAVPGAPRTTTTLVFNIFCCYGDVMRIKIMAKLDGAALVQFRESAQVS
jgi:hypothetical protein